MGETARGSWSAAVSPSVPHGLFGPDAVTPAWQVDAAVLLLACAAALFVVAGVLRLARWRLAGDQHSALVGSALVVMGGLYLPLEGIAAVGGALRHRELAEALIRALVSFVTVGLVLRALYSTRMRPSDRPSRLLPLLASGVLLVFGGLVALEASGWTPLPAGHLMARLLSGLMVVGWLVVAACVRTRNLGLPWSRRAAPLFAGVAAAEACYGVVPGTTVGTAAALVLFTVVAALSVWSAHLDLAAALARAERAFGSLSQMLRNTRRDADELSDWRANLVHDADNAVAGLQAALEVLGELEKNANGPEARLCRAAAEEVRHLDHLLHRSPQEPCRPFEVAALVQRVGQSARALGSNVSVRTSIAVALGRPDDLVVVLKNLLANTRRHATGAPVVLAVECHDGQVRIVCSDDGPGLDSTVARHAFDQGFRGEASSGSGLGLHEARALMRAQGGDLVLESQRSGARFVATLAASAEPVARIPAQRVGPSRADRSIGQRS